MVLRCIRSRKMSHLHLNMHTNTHSYVYTLIYIHCILVLVLEIYTHRYIYWFCSILHLQCIKWEWLLMAKDCIHCPLLNQAIVLTVLCGCVQMCIITSTNFLHNSHIHMLKVHFTTLLFWPLLFLLTYSPSFFTPPLPLLPPLPPYLT